MEKFDFIFHLLNLSAQFENLLLEAAEFLFFLHPSQPHAFDQSLFLCVLGRNLQLSISKGFKITSCCFPLFRKLCIILEGKTDLDLLDFLPYGLILLCPFHLSFQSNNLSLHLSDDVLNSKKVLLRGLHLHQGKPLSLLVFGDARGLFDQKTPVLWIGADEMFHPSLLDNRVTIDPDPRIQ